MNYHGYNKFDPVKFRSNLRDELSRCCRYRANYEHFNATVEKEVLNKHAPLKKESLQAKEGPFL